jgi:hypothetical protein
VKTYTRVFAKKYYFLAVEPKKDRQSLILFCGKGDKTGLRVETACDAA